jgi:hypothetical protein
LVRYQKKKGLSAHYQEVTYVRAQLFFALLSTLLGSSSRGRVASSLGSLGSFLFTLLLTSLQFTVRWPFILAFVPFLTVCPNKRLNNIRLGDHLSSKRILVEVLVICSRSSFLS